MDIDEERAMMITNAVGIAVLELRFRDELVTEYTISEKLEEMRQLETNVIGKGVCRDAAELVRSGRSKA
ncbi:MULTISPECIES: hypothetical protein [unclassified Pantoea]|uniref:hypothetical protein n=1 Tax=unclassified Pantoea TaxID=2630326 RepID=UPI001CD527A7|nr:MULTISPECIES: hypothetical protein [unclassified Pantoea]MCA1178904.1 hypothetical protein [Pantoea sp. alder69]MCA1253783.1 hypothetical protein [Pantoea sp. alder70]MCA1267393.1 hypothetical protein [Pantoea sp. alder81]